MDLEMTNWCALSMVLAETCWHSFRACIREEEVDPFAEIPEDERVLEDVTELQSDSNHDNNGLEIIAVW